MISEQEQKAIDILTTHEASIGLHPTPPIKAVAGALNIPEHEAAIMVDDLWRKRGLVSPQSDVLDGRDHPANHKWIWVRTDLGL